MNNKQLFLLSGDNYRLNPCTSGHSKLVDKIIAVAKKHNADSKVFLSHTQNKKKDPLTYEDKIKYATKAFGSIVTKSPSKTIIQVLKELENDGYKNIILVVGSDRVAEFDKLLNKYNGKDYSFDSIVIESAGERDPDSDGVDGMSASKMRKAAKDGDFELFKSGLPKKLNDADAKYLFNIIDETLVESAILSDFEDYLIMYGL